MDSLFRVAGFDSRVNEHMASDMPRVGREARLGTTEITWDFETWLGWRLKVGGMERSYSATSRSKIDSPRSGRFVATVLNPARRHSLNGPI